jgi:hypothetical protein
MPDQSQFEKDVAALRSHVIDGIEDLKQVSESIENALNRLFIVGCVIAVLILVHIVRHW